ncbi:hypothetical protein [Devosia sp.]|uniref:hypothetical protein n=1 Tax=Devosia sp. TaxID=1871048 RepID=UPI001AC998B0|nr:hypothetical protein [Devosia sp.]MBN9335059.1 hypothetical protein [Devosia sp.]
MLREATIEHYLNTVWCIAASRYVKEFMIGYTRRPLRQRLAEYGKQHEYQYMVILANGLTLADAHLLEKTLQDAIKADKSRMLYRKYSQYHRALPYTKSQGPSSAEPLAPVHTVYMAWWDQHS